MSMNSLKQTMGMFMALSIFTFISIMVEYSMRMHVQENLEKRIDSNYLEFKDRGIQDAVLINEVMHKSIMISAFKQTKRKKK